MLLLMLLQAAAQTFPDIVLDARAHVREVRIERRGETSLEVTGGPGSDVVVHKPETRGRSRLRNVDVAVRAEDAKQGVVHRVLEALEQLPLGGTVSFGRALRERQVLSPCS